MLCDPTICKVNPRILQPRHEVGFRHLVLVQTFDDQRDSVTVVRESFLCSQERTYLTQASRSRRTITVLLWAQRSPASIVKLATIEHSRC